MVLKFWKPKAGFWHAARLALANYLTPMLFLTRLLMHWVRPVSYTHLDVYKRQDYTSALIAAASDIAVSYTHLDVYKRQPQA